MFPRAYIFYTEPNATLYLEVKTENTSNVKLTTSNPYLKHHPDVKQMWDVANFQHPEAYHQYVLVVPDIESKHLTYAHLAKTTEVVYCIYDEAGLNNLSVISDDIAKHGPDYSLFTSHNHSPALALFSYENPNQDQHDLIHAAIHENFIQCQRPE
jgi:hypothetical protein